MACFFFAYLACALLVTAVAQPAQAQSTLTLNTYTQIIFQASSTPSKIDVQIVLTKSVPWLGCGFALENTDAGLGMSLKKNSQAAIGFIQPNLIPDVGEFNFSSLTVMKRVDGADLQTAADESQSCIISKCPNEITKCIGNRLCFQMLLCAGNSTAALLDLSPVVNATTWRDVDFSTDPATGNSPALLQLIKTRRRCFAPIFPNDTLTLPNDARVALDPLFGLMGCATGKCLSGARKRVAPVRSGFSNKFYTRNATHSILSFTVDETILTKNRPRSVYVAYGDAARPFASLDTPDCPLGVHGPTRFAHTTFTLSPALTVTASTKVDLSSAHNYFMLVLHAALTMIGFSLVYALGYTLSQWRKTSAFLGILIGLAGAILGSFFATEDDRPVTNNFHRSFGVFTICVAVLLGITDSLSLRLRLRSVVLLIVIRVLFLFGSLAVCAFSGVYLISASPFDSSSVMWIPYFVLACGAIATAAIVKRDVRLGLLCRRRPNHHRRFPDNDSPSLTMSEGTKPDVDLLSRVAKPSSSSLTKLAAVGGSFMTAPVQPFLIEFSQVSRTVASKDFEKTILKKSWGQFHPRSMTCVLGGSGSGKTSLLQILAGRIVPDLGSIITVNGKDRTLVTQNRTGFMAQDDCLHEFLTVRETFEFVAKLLGIDKRASTDSASTWTPENNDDDEVLSKSHQTKPLSDGDIVLFTMHTLGLKHVADTKVGGGQMLQNKGLSGGERRRVSIGLQLLKSPSFLLLDEPTSGLDSQTAYRIIRVVRDLMNKQGQTVVCSIHQPSPTLFDLFDDLILLHKGDIVYSGPRENCKTHFAACSFPVPAFGWSPADWYLYVVENENDSAVDAALALKALAGTGLLKSTATMKQPNNEDDDVQIDALKPKSSIALQIELLVQRSFALVARNPHMLRFTIFQNTIFGLILGSLFSRLTEFAFKAITKSNCIALLLGMVAFASISMATYLAYQERIVSQRESKDRLYSQYASFFARPLVTLTLNTGLSMLLIIPPYFWLGYKPDGASFFFFCFVCFAVVFLFDSLVYFVSLVVKDVNAAYLVANFYLALSVFFSADIVPLAWTPEYYRWIYWISGFSYPFAACLLNEFQETTDEWWIDTVGVPLRNKFANLALTLLMGFLWRGLSLSLIIYRESQTEQNLAVGIVKRKSYEASDLAKKWRVNEHGVVVLASSMSSAMPAAAAAAAPKKVEV